MLQSMRSPKNRTRLSDWSTMNSLNQVMIFQSHNLEDKTQLSSPQRSYGWESIMVLLRTLQRGNLRPEFWLTLSGCHLPQRQLRAGGRKRTQHSEIQLGSVTSAVAAHSFPLAVLEHQNHQRPNGTKASPSSDIIWWLNYIVMNLQCNFKSLR